MKSLGIIPARGGSKRLPQKNIKLLGDKPLLTYTIESALNSDCFSQVVVSSDDDAILDIARSYKDIAAIPRPAELAGDKTKVVELIQYFADQAQWADKYDAIGLLLPTCPFRRATDIQAAFRWLTPEIDTVITISEYDFPPNLSVTFGESDDSQRLQLADDLVFGNTRSQDLKPIYHPNGALYISWWDAFVVNRSFFKGKVRGSVMSRLHSVDIDDASDLAYAQFLLDSGAIKREDLA